MKPKILYISNSHKIGGGNRSLLTIIDNLRHHTNMMPVVFLPGTGEMATELRSRGVAYHVIPHEIGPHRFTSLPRVFRYLIAIWRIRPDLIHANDLFCHRLAAICGKALEIPVVCHMRFSVDSDAVRYHLKPKPRAIVFNSEFTKRRFLENNEGSEVGTIAEVVYNGFNPEYYLRAECRNRIRAGWGLQDERVIGILGNFARDKGHELFLEIAKRLVSLRDDLRFLVVGDDILEGGQRRLELEQLAHSLNLEDSVRFSGFVDDPASALAGFDVLVVPSHFEPFGRVAVEGLLAGIPVVASKTGGLIEILEGVPSGHLVSQGEVDSFVAAILQALNVDNTLCERAREIAQIRFGESSCFRKLITLYEAVMSHRVPALIDLP